MSADKSLYLVTILLLFVCSLFAQYKNRSTASLSKSHLDYNKRSLLKKESLADTTLFYGDSPTIFTVDPASGSGYVAGTNSYGDVAKWQRFDAGQPSILESFSIYFGVLTIVGTSDQIQVTVRQASGTGQTDPPGDIIYTDDMLTDQMDTTAKNTFSLTGQNVNVPASFFIGIEWTASVDDSFSLILDGENLGEGAHRAWEKWNDATMLPFDDTTQGWKLDTDLWIEAEVTLTSDVKYEKQTQKPFTLKQNYPNPFYSSTNIEFQISMKSDVSVDIYNTKGERIKQLYNGNLSPDKYSFTWNGIDDNGSFVSSGVYYVVLTNEINGNVSRVKKDIIHLK